MTFEDICTRLMSVDAAMLILIFLIAFSLSTPFSHFRLSNYDVV